jgi:hypothetical protein
MNEMQTWAVAISQALPNDAETVSNILLEAAEWLRERDIPMWRADELSRERIAIDVAEGHFFSWPGATASQSERSSSNCKTLFSGPILPRMRRLLFIDWPFAARSRAASFPPCYYIGRESARGT